MTSPFLNLFGPNTLFDIQRFGITILCSHSALLQLIIYSSNYIFLKHLILFDSWIRVKLFRYIDVWLTRSNTRYHIFVIWMHNTLQ